MRRGTAAGVLVGAAAVVHLVAAGWPADRMARVGVVKEALLLPSTDMLAWTVLLCLLAVAAARLLPEDAADRARNLVLRPGPRLFAFLVFAWVAVAGTVVSRILLADLPTDPDDIARLHQARTFLAGRLWLEAPPEVHAFGVYGLLERGGRWFSKYEPATALLYAFSWRTFGSPGALNPLLGGALVAGTYSLGRRACGEATARAAALLLCISPFVLFMSGSLLSHAFSAAVLMGACLVAASEARNPAAWKLAALGTVIAVSGAARPFTTALFGGVVAGWAVLRAGIRRAPLRALPVVLGAAPVAGLVLWYNETLTGDPLLSPFHAFDPREVPWFGYMGHTVGEGLANTARMAFVLNAHLFGWPASLLFLPLAALRPRVELDRLAAAVVAVLVLGHVAYYWVDFRFGPRYWYEATPFLAWLTARGLGGLDGFLRGVGVPATGHRTALAAVALFTAFGAAFYLGPVTRLYARDYGGLRPMPLAVVRDRWEGGEALVFVPFLKKVENGGFSSAFLANPLELSAVARLDRARAEVGEDVPAAAARAGLPPEEAGRILREGRVVFAQDRGEASRARVAAAFPGRRHCLLEEEPGGGGVAIRAYDGGRPGEVLLRVPVAGR